MRRIFSFLSGALTLGLILVAFSAGKAAAATVGCFNDTNGNWAETYICWMKDNGITTGTGGGNYSPNNNVTRAEMAVFMKRLSDIPPSQGDIQVTLSPKEWEIIYPELTPWVAMDHQTMSTIVTSTQTGMADFRATTPTLPTALYGRNLALSRVEICYKAYFTSLIQRIIVQVTDSSSLFSPTDDYTARTTEGCAVYTYSPAITLHDGSYLSFLVRGNWSLTTYPIRLDRVVITLTPTTMLVGAAPELDLPAPDAQP
jgi:hypothetical protein